MEKRMAYALENGVTPGFNAIDDGPEYKINEDPMDKVDKALATPFPRDVEKIEDEKYEDVMHRVVNHAHQRNPKKSGHNPLRQISFSRKQQNKHCTVYSFQRVNTRSNVARN
ncbi:hypothetical protein ACVXHB_04725 [Escherichia coli]